jgi:hypothetical protein
MTITYPDNPKRETRVRELATTIQNDLFEARRDFLEFKALCATANAKIAEAYAEAGLTAPEVSDHEVAELEGVTDPTHTTVVSVVKVVFDAAGMTASLIFFVPGVTQLLVKTGVMTAEDAASTLIKLPFTILGRELSITAGEFVSGILVSVAAGVAIAGIDIGIDAIEGAHACSQLRDAIHALHPMRLATRISVERSRLMLRSVRSVVDTMTAITGATGNPLSEKQLNNLINSSVRPAVEEAKKITPENVAASLADYDTTNKSWTKEDQ